MDNPAPQAYTDIDSNAALTLYPRQGLNTGYLGISNVAKPFDDMRCVRPLRWLSIASW